LLLVYLLVGSGSTFGCTGCSVWFVPVTLFGWFMPVVWLRLFTFMPWFVALRYVDCWLVTVCCCSQLLLRCWVGTLFRCCCCDLLLLFGWFCGLLLICLLWLVVSLLIVTFVGWLLLLFVVDCCYVGWLVCICHYVLRYHFGYLTVGSLLLVIVCSRLRLLRCCSYVGYAPRSLLLVGSGCCYVVVWLVAFWLLLPDVVITCCCCCFGSVVVVVWLFTLLLLLCFGCWFVLLI